MLKEIMKTHADPDKQLGFKKNSSCAHAIFTVKETIANYNKKKKKVYGCAIDASKAFDKVNRDILFKKLKDKVHPQIWRSLKNYYSNSMALVVNGSEISKFFKTTIGVKQGGPLSPKLFSIYAEDLIRELERKNLGTRIHEYFTGVVMYADDILLLTTSLKELQEALNICEKYGIQQEIKFNPEKTQFIVFGEKLKASDQKPRMYNQEIKCVEKIRYLGVILNRNNNNKDQVESRIKTAFRSFYTLRNLQSENTYLTTKIKIHLYEVFVRPTLTYGFENYVLTKEQIKKMQTTEATMIKKMLNLKKTSRTTNLLNALGLEKMENKLIKGKLSFIKRLLNNNLTLGVLKELETKSNQTKDLSKKSIVKEVFDHLEKDEISISDIIQLIEINTKELTKIESNGISDSIKICLENMGNETYRKMLVELTKSF